MTNKKEIYVCMECSKIYDEDPSFCKDKKGKIHSLTTDDRNCIGGKIFRFELGDYSLKNTPLFIRQTPKYALERAGFDVILDLKYPGNGSIYKEDREKIEKKVKNVTAKLNSLDKEYLFFCECEFPGDTYYTFMERKD